MIPTTGRTVHYIVPETGVIRPAIIVNVHIGDAPAAKDDTLVNLQVFMDSDGRAYGDRTPALVWKTSVGQGVERGQWFDPLRQDAPKSPVPVAKATVAAPAPAAAVEAKK